MGRRDKFLWSRNLERGVISELQMLDFVLFFFCFHFILVSLLFRYGLA